MTPWIQRVLLRAVVAFAIASGSPSTPAHAASTSFSDPPDLSKVLDAHGDQLGSLSSDAPALEFYRKQLAPALGLKDTVSLLEENRRRARRTGTVPLPVLREPALELTTALVAWFYSRSLREAAEAVGSSALSQFIADREAQQQWLSPPLEGQDPPAFARATSLAHVLVSFEDGPPPDRVRPIAYAELAAYLDRSYPELTGPNSWSALAERDGTKGIWSRLREFWKENPADEPLQKQAGLRYFNSRLRPVLKAHVSALSIHAQAEAEREARARWSELRSWRKAWSTRKGLYRLCGTWAWIVHNHQSHQDHKMVMAFPPPGSSGHSGPVPDEVVVFGDTVYLRWEFQGGYQEDSLLFSARDARLEGTFRNSRGPYGSITGKRTARCPAQD